MILQLGVHLPPTQPFIGFYEYKVHGYIFRPQFRRLHACTLHENKITVANSF